MPKSPRSQFTLIELLVVVAIIGLLSSCLMPSLISAASRAKKSQAGPNRAPSKTTQSLSQDPISAMITSPEGKILRRLEVLSSELDVQLTVYHILDGFSASTHYTSQFKGLFVIQQQAPVAPDSGAHLTLQFPFPPGMTEAQDVRFLIAKVEAKKGFLKQLSQRPLKDFKEPQSSQLNFTRNSIVWHGPSRAGQCLAVRIEYTTEGREAFRYAPNIEGRSRHLRVKVRVNNSPRSRIPPPSQAMQPTLVEDFKDEAGRGQVFQWSLDNAITLLPIVVELPSSQSPLGRLVLLGQLAGLAIFLFGAGFFYLSEGAKPGQLDDFGWSHFLLLAISYFLFFPVFAVLEKHLGFWPATGLGVVTSLPLMTFHVARFTSWSFALRRSLPWSALTLALVLAGVYLPDDRFMIATASVVLVITYLTLDLERWLEVTDAYALQKSKCQQYQRKIEALDKSAALQKHMRTESEAFVRSIEESLRREDCPPELAVLPHSFASLRENFEQRSADHQAWLNDLKALKDSTPEDIADQLEPLLQRSQALDIRAERLSNSLKGAGRDFRAILEQLDRARKDQRLRVEGMLKESQSLFNDQRNTLVSMQEALKDHHLRLQGLSESSKDNARAKSKALDLAITEEFERFYQHQRQFEELRRGQDTSIDAGFQDDVRALLEAGRNQRRRIERMQDQVKDNESFIDETLVRELKQKSQQQGGEAQRCHCQSCGHENQLDHKYCSACSQPLAKARSCSQCESVTLIPLHLIGRTQRKRLKSLHCRQCGAAFGEA